MQTSTNIGMDKYDDKSIEGLKSDGTNLYASNKDRLEAMIRTIIDEKYGAPVPAPPAPTPPAPTPTPNPPVVSMVQEL
jgi:hypothetical protein